MRKTLILISLLFAFKAYSQVAPEWKTPIEGAPNSIYFHSFTQTPIVETSRFYYGINPVDKSITWTIKKSEAMAAMQVARTASSLTGSSDVTEGMDLEQYYEIPNTQFACINNNVVDVASGVIILGEGNNPIKSLISDNIIPQLNLLLLKVRDVDNSEKLYAIDIATSNIQWATKITEASAAKDAMKFISKNLVMNIDLFKPSVNGSSDIVYNNSGKLLLINSKSGEIMWENNCNPGTFFLNEDQSKIIVPLKPSGLSSMTMAKPFGKKVVAIDAASGKNLWADPIELDGTYKTFQFLTANELLIASNNGINLYNITTGKKMWKKDFEASNLKNIANVKDGLELQYGNKLMVINPKTGVKVWKKPIVLDGIDENAEFDPLTKSYAKTLVVVAPTDIYTYDKLTGKKLWSKSFGDNARIGFDDTNSKIIVVSKKQVYLFNPDEQVKAPKAIDVKISNPKEIVGYEVKDNGYFIYGQKEYLLVSKSGEVVVNKEYSQLKGKRMLNAGLLAASIATGVMGAEVTVTTSDGQQTDCGLFVDPETAKSFQETSAAQADYRRQLKANDKKRRAVRSDKNSAYFIKGETVNGNSMLSLVIVDKNTGVEAKIIDFSTDRDAVYETDFNNGKLYYVENGQFNMFQL